VWITDSDETNLEQGVVCVRTDELLSTVRTAAAVVKVLDYMKRIAIFGLPFP